MPTTIPTRLNQIEPHQIVLCLKHARAAEWEQIGQHPARIPQDAKLGTILTHRPYMAIRAGSQKGLGCIVRLNYLGGYCYVDVRYSLYCIYRGTIGKGTGTTFLRRRGRLSCCGGRVAISSYNLYLWVTVSVPWCIHSGRRLVLSLVRVLVESAWPQVFKIVLIVQYRLALTPPRSGRLCSAASHGTKTSKAAWGLGGESVR